MSTTETQSDVDVNATPASSKLWLKDSGGYPSVTITFLFVSFWVTTLAYVLSIVGSIGPVQIRSFDSGACAAYFGVVFGAYVARRATEAKWGNPNVSVVPTNIQVQAKK